MSPDSLPMSAGVYFHHDKKGEIIYIGKAANLRNRVRSYSRQARTRDAKTRALVNDIAKTTWRTTESELDALFLESELVKRYRPKYNILLQDDKSAVFLRLGKSAASEVPYISIVHNPVGDGKYFGPYYAKLPLRKALKALRRIFPFYDKPYDGKRSLYSQLNLTPALELAEDKVEYASRLKTYKANLRIMQRVLAGKRTAVAKSLQKEMEQASKQQDFEQAAKLRNQIQGLKALSQAMIFASDEFVELSADPALEELGKVLRMPEPPRQIEGFDISHQSGTNVVGSCVVFKNGVASRAGYRMFKLGKQRNNDFANMREVIIRRLKHLEDWGKPDLVLIDGGVGQLTAVEDLLMEAGIRVAGWNKSSQELIVVNQNGFHRTVKLKENSHAYKLIVRIDSEAHRFAINYHTKLKRQSALKK